MKETFNASWQGQNLRCLIRRLHHHWFLSFLGRLCFWNLWSLGLLVDHGSASPFLVHLSLLRPGFGCDQSNSAHLFRRRWCQRLEGLQFGLRLLAWLLGSSVIRLHTIGYDWMCRVVSFGYLGEHHFLSSCKSLMPFREYPWLRRSSRPLTTCAAQCHR